MARGGAVVLRVVPPDHAGIEGLVRRRLLSLADPGQVPWVIFQEWVGTRTQDLDLAWFQRRDAAATVAEGQCLRAMAGVERFEVSGPRIEAKPLERRTWSLGGPLAATHLLVGGALAGLHEVAQADPVYLGVPSDRGIIAARQELVDDGTFRAIVDGLHTRRLADPVGLTLPPWLYVAEGDRLTGVLHRDGRIERAAGGPWIA